VRVPSMSLRSSAGQVPSNMHARQPWSVLAAAAVAAPTIAAAAPRAQLSEESRTVSRATITIDAPPAEVYALVTDYAAWPTFFKDVKWTKVLSGGRGDARVRMHTYSLGHTVTVAFDNIKDRAVRFKLVDGPPGARAKGEYILDPLDNGTRTRVNAVLYMDVVGVPGLLVTDKRIRKMRNAKLRGDLEDGAIELERRAAARR
jgi:uncharacterized membrane protein